jgi:hypothetical protein
MELDGASAPFSIVILTYSAWAWRRMIVWTGEMPVGAAISTGR